MESLLSFNFTVSYCVGKVGPLQASYPARSIVSHFIDNTISPAYPRCALVPGSTVMNISLCLLYTVSHIERKVMNIADGLWMAALITTSA